ncbi:Spy0128 family protein, partial [Porcincola sp. LCP21S3_C12]|uniref:Spy0128 family protein n=1 Tax=Porcincola sp. LCP21S3_C12 TaxID=3438798 RepID=UPI003F9B70AE
MKKQRSNSLYRMIMAMLLVVVMVVQQGAYVLADETVPQPVTETSAAQTETPASEKNTESAAPASQPETAAPETKAPETAAPETKAPETTAPETAAPETKVAETAAPETAAPEAKTPETKTPETAAPKSETKASETASTEKVRENVVSFAVAEGAKVYVDGKDVTNQKGTARDGKIIFKVVPETGYAITSVKVDDTKDARNTHNENEYIIEGIQTDNTVVRVTMNKVETEKAAESETTADVKESETEIAASTESVKETETASESETSSETEAASEAASEAMTEALTEEETEAETEKSVNTVTTYTYSDSDVYVVATIDNPDVLPDDASLQVSRVSTSAYLNQLNTLAPDGVTYSNEDAIVYDIHFAVPEKDGQKAGEVEPDNGLVHVAFKFKNGQLSSIGADSANDVAVVHLAGGATEIAANVSVAAERAAFSAESFSPYAFLIRCDEKDPGNNKLRPKEPDQIKEGVTFENAENNVNVNDGQRFDYYKLKGELGILANFGLVGFDSINTKGNHVNSNLATKHLSGGTTFGTNHRTEGELSYIGESINGQYNLTAQSDNSQYNGSVLVLGKDVVVSNGQNDYQYKDGDGVNWSLQINPGNGVTNDYNSNQGTIVWKEASNTKFLDLDSDRDSSMKKQAISLEKRIAGYQDCNATINTEKSSDSVVCIDVGDSTDVSVINLDGSLFASDKKGIDIKASDPDKSQVIIINIDTRNKKTNEIIQELYIHGITINGEEQTTGEVVGKWTKKNVLINLFSSDSNSDSIKNEFSGKVSFTEHSFGTVLAPNGTVNANSNMNGEIIANTINIGAEFHKSSFTFGGKIVTGAASVFITGSKTVNGVKKTDLPAFRFIITADHGNPFPGETNTKTVTNSPDGSIDFGELKFTEEGTYNITVTEDVPHGYTCDPENYNIQIIVEKDEQNSTYKVSKLSCNDKGFLAKGNESCSVAFNNTTTDTYEAKGKITFGGTKTLENRGLKDKEFTFVLTKPDGTTETVKNNADGSFKFPPINYTLADLNKKDGKYVDTTKTYKITELAGADNTVVYDSSEYEVTVTLHDDGNGNIEVACDKKPDGASFTNTYGAKSTITFGGTKTLENRGLKDKEFTFVLAKPDGTTETVKNNADGSFKFPPINYTLADLDKKDGKYVDTTKTYKITELAGADNTVVYDSSEYEVTVTLHDDGNGNIEVACDKKPDGASFTNTYGAKSTITFGGTKTLENRGLKDKEFTFVLAKPDGTTETVKNNADGSFKFPPINYTLADLDKKDGK